MTRIAIIGSGPAGLMAATVVSQAGYPVTIFEKKRGPAKKLLLAGSTGLNITFDAPPETFHCHYRGSENFIENILKQFSPEAWRRFVHDLGIKTFLGTSRRYFVEGLKASPLLRQWLLKLKGLGCEIRYGHELADFSREDEGSIRLEFAHGAHESVAAVCLAFGGGSYESRDTLTWPVLLRRLGLKFHSLRPANAGFNIDWPEEFLKEVEGKPLKNIRLTTSLGSVKGDLMITRYGLEGTPIYTVGAPGVVYLDLKSDLSDESIAQKLLASIKKLSPFRAIQKYLNLSPSALALLFHLTSPADRQDLKILAALVKALPLTLKNARPLDEAISSSGGLDLGEMDGHLMLNQYPGVFAAGEMLDWSAPTGGFLIQACVSQGYVAGQGMVLFAGRV